MSNTEQRDLTNTVWEDDGELVFVLSIDGALNSRQSYGVAILYNDGWSFYSLFQDEITWCSEITGMFAKQAWAMYDEYTKQFAKHHKQAELLTNTFKTLERKQGGKKSTA